MVNTRLLPSFDGHPQQWMVLDRYPQTNFSLHQHAGISMATKELELTPMPLNTISNERTQTCIDAAQAAQHCRTHALIFFINCRLSLLITGVQDEQFISKGQLQ
jgi:hypothetical protein